MFSSKILTRNFALFFLITVSMFLIFPTGKTLSTLAQSSEPLSIIDAAYANLSQKLGKSIARGGSSNYTWSQDVYSDTSLGCPQQGQTYTKANTVGYKIVITYQGAAYDYRASLDGKVLFQCTATSGAPGGSSNPPSSGGGNSLPPGPALVVGGKARVVAGQTAPLFQNPVNISPEGIGDGAQGLIVNLNQGEIVDVVAGPQIFSNTRWWQVRASNGAVGWTFERYPGRPAGTPDILEPVAVQVQPPQPAQPASPGGTLSKPYAFVDVNGNILATMVGQQNRGTVTGDSTAQVTPQWPFYSTSKRYGQIRWSPDGNMLVFYDEASATGYFSFGSGKPIVVVANQPLSGPMAWSPDGTRIAYAVGTNQTAGDMKFVQQVRAVSLTGNQLEGLPFAPAVQVGTFVQDSCPGGGGQSFDLADLLYLSEVGAYGNGFTLEWTPKGFVHTRGCDGIGVALTDFSGKDLWTADFVGHLAVSPDQTRAAVSIRNPAGNTPGLGLLDLNTGAVTPVPAQPGVDRIAWSPDGQTLIYSTLVGGPVVQGAAGNAVGNQLFPGMWPRQSQGNTVALWRVAASGGQSVKMFERLGRGIGSISVAPDNSGVAFSFIMSGTQMIEAINGGASAAQVLDARPRDQLFFLGWDANAQPVSLGEGGKVAFTKGTISVNNAQPQPSSGSGGNPGAPALVVGKQAVVITQGTTLNVRNAPSRGATVVRLLNPGTVVTIIGGPQQADGFRWWQVSVNDAQGGSGWVVDQFTDETGTTNTLAPR